MEWFSNKTSFIASHSVLSVIFMAHFLSFCPYSSLVCKSPVLWTKHCLFPTPNAYVEVLIFYTSGCDCICNWISLNRDNNIQLWLLEWQVFPYRDICSHMTTERRPWGKRRHLKSNRRPQMKPHTPTPGSRNPILLMFKK